MKEVVKEVIKLFYTWMRLSTHRKSESLRRISVFICQIFFSANIRRKTVIDIEKLNVMTSQLLHNIHNVVKLRWFAAEMMSVLTIARLFSNKITLFHALNCVSLSRAKKHSFFLLTNYLMLVLTINKRQISNNVTLLQIYDLTVHLFQPF